MGSDLLEGRVLGGGVDLDLELGEGGADSVDETPQLIRRGCGLRGFPSLDRGAEGETFTHALGSLGRAQFALLAQRLEGCGEPPLPRRKVRKGHGEPP